MQRWQIWTSRGLAAALSPDLRLGGWAALAGRDLAWLTEQEEALTADMLDRLGWGFRPPSLCSQSGEIQPLRSPNGEPRRRRFA
uniref:Uncharacterized protein n=1 Tax=Kalanchoe fedtschenkoi TaxID=63787 RepID=A0A7N0VCS9_KALFE